MMRFGEMTFSSGELKVFIELLERACDEMSNHGCNDFSLVSDVSLSPTEVKQVVDSMNATFTSPDELPRQGNYHPDWLLLSLLKKKLENCLHSL